MLNPELFDFTREAGGVGRSSFLASVVVEGAFGAGPHAKLVDTFEAAGVGNWPVFRATGQCFVNFEFDSFFQWLAFVAVPEEFPAACPREEFFPPFLWVAHINLLIPRIQSTMGAGGVPSGIFVRSAMRVIFSARRAITCAPTDHTRMLLLAVGLGSSHPKSVNFITAPTVASGDSSRRCPNAYRVGVLQVKIREDPRAVQCGIGVVSVGPDRGDSRRTFLAL